MKAHCGYCGEEMMGAVNRCWRCGHHFAAAPDATGEPPIRREPISKPLDGNPVDGGTQAFHDNSLGSLEQLATPRGSRWGTPFQSDFEPTVGDRWRRQQRRLYEWIRLVVGDPTLAALRKDSTKDTDSVTVATSADCPLPSGTRRQSADSTPSSPLANAAAGLALALSLIAFGLSSYPLIALAMGGMAVALATLSQWLAPRGRTVVLISLAVVVLVIVGWETWIGTYFQGGGAVTESEEIE